MSDTPTTTANVVAPGVFHQPTLLGGAENMKLLFDEELDNRRESLANARAWEAVKLSQAQNDLRRQQNAATIDHLAQIGLLQLGQTGATENQQTVSPISRGEGDSAAAQSYPPNRAIDVANPAIADALAAVVNALNVILEKVAGQATDTPTK
jgi:hypothetical protein